MPPGPDPDPDEPPSEVASLKRKFDELRSRVDELEAQRRGILDGLSARTGLSRRQLMAIAATGGGVGGLAALGAQDATAAPQPSGGEGDFGSPSSPWEGWSDGLAQVTQTISSATTVTKQVVPYDCSVSGFTITLGNELEPSSGCATRVVLIDETGNAGTNQVTVDTESGNGIDGGSSITINHDDAVTVLWWDGSEFRSTRFIDTVDAGSVGIGDGDVVTDWEFGTDTITGPGAAADSTTDTRAVNQKAVSFSNTFASDPIVVASVNQDGYSVIDRVSAVSTTGFNLSVINLGTDDLSGRTWDFWWVAVEA